MRSGFASCAELYGISFTSASGAYQSAGEMPYDEPCIERLAGHFKRISRYVRQRFHACRHSLKKSRRPHDVAGFAVQMNINGIK
jgi:hypothetical protein